MRYLFTICALIFITPPSYAVDVDELKFMIEFFNSIQQRTFDNNREFCGYVGIDENGNFTTTEPTKGDADSCLANDPPEDFEDFASYHTHGAFSIDADSELPSSNDLIIDIEEQVDGYIATPGGRIWFNDSQNKITTMLCENCVMHDPNFNGELLDPVKKTYTVKQIQAREMTQ